MEDQLENELCCIAGCGQEATHGVDIVMDTGIPLWSLRVCELHIQRLGIGARIIRVVSLTEGPIGTTTDHAPKL